MSRVDHLLLQSNSDAFDQAVNRLIADGNDRELLDCLRDLRSIVEGLRSQPDDRFDAWITVCNACSAAAIALRRGKRGVVDSALDALLATYRLGAVERDGAGEDDLRLYEEAAGDLWALGAIAVREGDWRALRSIVERQPVEGGVYATWLRHAQVMSARGSSDPADDNILNLARQRLRTQPGFGMTSAAEEDRQRAVCGFDQLALIVTASIEAAKPRDFFQSYPKYPADCVEPFVINLRKRGPQRDAIFPGPDEQLRAVLRTANEKALLQAGMQRQRGTCWVYEGYQDPRTWLFIIEGNMLEDFGP